MIEMNICFAADNNYAPYMGTAIASVLKNSLEDEKITFHLIDGGISEENKKKIDSLKEIKDFKIKYYIPDTEKYEIWRNNITDKLEKADYISKATFYRLDIPYILENIDKKVHTYNAYTFYKDYNYFVRSFITSSFSPYSLA